MFFKRKMPVTEYYDMYIREIFSDEQTQRITQVVNNTDDTVLRTLDPQTFADEIRAMQLQLLEICVVKSHRDVMVHSVGSWHLTQYLKNSGNERLEPIMTAYNRAFGSSSTDGVAEMGKLANSRLCDGRLTPDLVEWLISLMYSSLRLKYKYLKGIKLVPR